MSDILFVDDDDAWLEIYKEISDTAGYDCDFVNNTQTAISQLTKNKYKLICTNYHIKNLGMGRGLLGRLFNYYPDIPVLLITGYVGGSFREATKSFENLQSRYPNIKDVLIKGSLTNDEFYESLQHNIADLMHSTETTPLLLPVIKNKAISWLHLSDLHIGSDKIDWHALKEALFNDLKAHQKMPLAGHCAQVSFQPDLIFITGDIAYKAEEKEYNEAEAFLKEIWKITNLGKDQTFIVAGNHDVQRYIVTNSATHEAAYQQLANQGLSQPDWYKTLHKWRFEAPLQNLWEQKFEQFLKFKRRFTAINSTKGYYAYSIPELNVNILGLNSALMSWKDKEDLERGLWIGQFQIEEVKDQLSADSLTIILVHHPREALHFQDETWEEMEELCVILLHGHLHKSSTKLIAEPEREHIRILGGAISQGGRWESQRYTYGQFDFETKELNLYMRKTKAGSKPIYIRDNETYPKEAPDGHLKITLRK